MSQDAQNYKDSINLPQTDFPMKADLATREPEFIELWKKSKSYSQMVASGKKGQFVMPDGPPYANGGIHMGHTLNKCLKDFTIKYQNLKGLAAPFIPGWDCHGLPIEHKVLKDLDDKKVDKREITPKQIRELCRKEALTWVAHQGEQFQRLGILADWENPYLTLHASYEAEEVRELARIMKNGVLYRGKKPVYWCYALQTALAEAEIEYKQHKSPAVYVKFPIRLTEKFGSFKSDPSFVIWTTTPWTLPANLGIALNKDFDYGIYDSEKGLLIIAQAMKEAVEKDTGLTLTPVGKSFKGSEFEGLKAKHPFYDRDSLVILGEHVTAEAGTGCVHTAPGHGQDDYLVGLQYKLDILSPVNERAEFTEEVPEYKGLHVFKANPLIVERLKESGQLVGFKTIEHSYPHCWRSKVPLIFRATSQWFINMDHKDFNIREKSLAAINNEISFVPDWGIKRLTAMIEARPDWCISRQRNWGVPIPVLYCTECDHPHITEEFLLSVADKMDTHAGIEYYFESSVETLLNNKELACPSCSHKTWRKGTDILDVWFDSGVCHAAVQKKRDGLGFPADLYLEGSDQHRGWFQTSLISSVASNGKPPFKKLLTHNFVNDEHGRKMSKSLGNYVDPMELIGKSGAELLRLWTASQDYGQDMNYSAEGFKRISETYRRLRNTFRFLLGNISDFKKTDAVPYEKLLPLDKWALYRLNHLIAETTLAYDNFEYYKVYQLLNNFFTVDLSAHYLDILKDRLYTWKTDGLGRRSAQTVLTEITLSLASIMAPITSFLSEESYQFYPLKEKASIFECGFPQVRPEWNNKQIKEDFEILFGVRDFVSKKLEVMRQSKVIGASLETFVTVHATGNEFKTLEAYKEHLSEFFIVSQVNIVQGEKQIDAVKATAEKCPRCWNYSVDIGKNAQHPLLCPKCVGALT